MAWCWVRRTNVLSPLAKAEGGIYHYGTVMFAVRNTSANVSNQFNSLRHEAGMESSNHKSNCMGKLCIKVIDTIPALHPYD